jgi:cytochrome oxidase Cu insertion factor (SCO1/SenC/PrrC family)
LFPRGSRTWFAAALLAAALTGGAGAGAADSPAEEPRARAARLMNELMSGKAQVGVPFTLTNQHGKRVSLADFRGKLVLLYFGFTFCPDVCPTDLLAIGQAVKSLGKAGDDVQPVFITLDPARDTRELLRDYAAAFHPRFIALTGSESEIHRIATGYKVYYEKVTPPDSKTYSIAHAAFTFLLDRNGKYVLFFPPSTPPERMSEMVREQLSKK